MTAPLLLGIDPGFAALGLAHVALVGAGEDLVKLGLIRTAASPKKRSVRAADDNVRRTMELAAELAQWVTPDVVAICAESQSWPRSSSVCAKLGMAWGAVSTLAQVNGLPVLQATPMVLKHKVAGHGSASKAQVEAALEARYGPLGLDCPKSLREHPVDALGSVVACLDAPPIMMARRMAAGDWKGKA